MNLTKKKLNKSSQFICVLFIWLNIREHVTNMQLGVLALYATIIIKNIGNMFIF